MLYQNKIMFFITMVFLAVISCKIQSSQYTPTDVDKIRKEASSFLRELSWVSENLPVPGSQEQNELRDVVIKAIIVARQLTDEIYISKQVVHNVENVKQSPHNLTSQGSKSAQFDFYEQFACMEAERLTSYFAIQFEYAQTIFRSVCVK